MGAMTTTSGVRAVLVGVCGLALVACSLDRIGIGAGSDAGSDAGPAPELDGGGLDAGDAGEIDAGIADAGTDAGVDAGTDSGFDAGQDGGQDAGQDGGQDGGQDAGPPPPRPCATTYAGVPGFELCAERATECELFTDGPTNASCTAVCAAAGGTCISARSEGGSTNCGPGGPQDCAQESNDQVCICSRP